MSFTDKWIKINKTYKNQYISRYVKDLKRSISGWKSHKNSRLHVIEKITKKSP